MKCDICGKENLEGGHLIDKQSVCTDAKCINKAVKNTVKPFQESFDKIIGGGGTVK
jgi:hypothetical protein